MPKYIVQYSGGTTSYWAARRAVDQHGKENVICLFADVLMEDEDCYRFINETIPELGCEYVRIADGRDPYQVFKDERYLGNSRRDPCSKILKRKLLKRWITENCDLNNDVIVYGLDWTENDRLENVTKRSSWKCWFPLAEPPYYDKHQLNHMLRDRGIEPPRLYAMGFAHNNCGGACVKAGQAQWALLLKTMPERYAWHEAKEQEVRDHLGKPVTILRRQENKKYINMTLTEFRKRVETDDYDMFDWGGCGCAL